MISRRELYVNSIDFLHVCLRFSRGKIVLLAICGYNYDQNINRNTGWLTAAMNVLEKAEKALEFLKANESSAK